MGRKHLKMRQQSLWRIRAILIVFSVGLLFQNCARVQFGSQAFRANTDGNTPTSTNPPGGNNNPMCPALDLKNVGVMGPRTIKVGETGSYQLENWPTTGNQCPLTIKAVEYSFGDNKKENPTTAPYLVHHAWTPATLPQEYTVTVSVNYNYYGKDDKLTLTFKVTVVSAPASCDVTGAGITGPATANLIPFPTLKHTLTLPTCLYSSTNFDAQDDIKWSLTGPDLASGATGQNWEFTHTYTTAGSFVLKAIVTDTTMGTLTYTHPVEIINNFVFTPINGVCGKANGGSFDNGWAVIAAGMCEDVNTIKNVAGSGPWTWTCIGLFGGQNATCSAGLLTTTPPPAPTPAPAPPTTKMTVTKDTCLVSLFYGFEAECSGGAKVPCEASSFFELIDKNWKTAPQLQGQSCSNVGFACAAGPCKKSFGGLAYICPVYKCQ